MSKNTPTVKALWKMHDALDYYNLNLTDEAVCLLTDATHSVGKAIEEMGGCYHMYEMGNTVEDPLICTKCGHTYE